MKFAFENYSRSFDLSKDSQIFSDILALSDSESGETLRQIENDMSRTILEDDFFQPPNQGFKSAVEVLRAFSLYDQSWGYVQGMNFIIASLVFHWESSSAFWLFTSLMEDYNLRKNYMKGLEGIYEKAEDIRELVQSSNTELYSFLVGVSD